MNAVYCETRAACCIEWVTMTIVYSSLSSSINSSIFEKLMRRASLMSAGRTAL